MKPENQVRVGDALVPDAPPTADEHMAATSAVNVAGSDHNPFLVVPVEGAAASGAVYVLDVNGSATRTANVHIATVPTSDPRSMRSPGRHHEPALAAPMMPAVGSVAMASSEHDQLGPVPVMVMAIVRANVNNANVRALDNIDMHRPHMYRPHMYRLHNMMGVVIRQRQAAAVASYAHRRRNKSQTKTHPTDHHR